jgi:hypothetical protein
MGVDVGRTGGNVGGRGVEVGGIGGDVGGMGVEVAGIGTGVGGCGAAHAATIRRNATATSSFEMGPFMVLPPGRHEEMAHTPAREKLPRSASEITADQVRLSPWLQRGWRTL